MTPVTKEAKMPVGKARAAAPDSGDGDYQLTVPCFSAIDRNVIQDHLDRDQFFWLDLTGPTDGDLRALDELFHFHPLALHDAAEFSQRPKLNNYGGYAFMVFYGAGEAQAGNTKLCEVHMFISGHYLITIHRSALPQLQEQQEELKGQRLHSEQFLIYRVLDTLTDSFFPVMSAIDDEIDSLQDAVVAMPTNQQLDRLFLLKRQLVAMRKVITPERDVFARSVDQLDELPGLSLDERDYFRDIYDNLIRINDLLDSYRDLLSGATDLYLSTISNRQNEVTKQLTVIATIFLPLSFITGFFGQNFGYLVTDLIDAAWTFWVVGVGSMVVTVAALLVYFRRKGWVGRGAASSSQAD